MPESSSAQSRLRNRTRRRDIMTDQMQNRVEHFEHVEHRTGSSTSSTSSTKNAGDTG